MQSGNFNTRFFLICLCPLLLPLRIHAAQESPAPASEGLLLTHSEAEMCLKDEEKCIQLIREKYVKHLTAAKLHSCLSRSVEKAPKPIQSPANKLLIDYFETIKKSEEAKAGDVINTALKQLNKARTEKDLAPLSNLFLAYGYAITATHRMLFELDPQFRVAPLIGMLHAYKDAKEGASQVKTWVRYQTEADMLIQDVSLKYIGLAREGGEKACSEDLETFVLAEKAAAEKRLKQNN